MYTSFILLFLCNIANPVLIMKKQKITHPKLYFNYKNNFKNTELYFYSNQLNSQGERVVQKDIISNCSFVKDNLFKLNENEFNKLNIYIKRQEKVLSVYKRKNLNDQTEIINESLLLMKNFHVMFKDWFKKYDQKLDWNSL